MTHQFIRVVCACCGYEKDVPVYCGDRFCEVCGHQRRSRVRNRLNWIVNHNEEIAGYSMKHLTLTIPNQADLAGMVKVICKAFRRLRQRKFWKDHVAGGAFVMEVSGTDLHWHVHIHAIIYSKYLPYFKLLKLWKECSTGQGVYIQAIPPSQVIRYLTKYLTKPSISDNLLPAVNEELYGARLFHPFGSWHSISLQYKQPKTCCPSCGETMFLPLDIFMGESITYHSIEVERSPPEDEVPERCPLTVSLEV